MTAKTFKGLEPVLADELLAIGANNIEIGRRAVSFTGDLSVLYKANFRLRTASRVLVPIASFRAKDADGVYQGCKGIDWEQFMGVNTSFLIDATVYSETFRHSHYVTYRVKDAIADYWMEKAGKRPSVQLTNPDLYLNVHIAAEQVTISLDSSGESLHKRGYRVANTEAPLSEALAAGMLLLAGWEGKSDFYDPMCGSGTLGIEAALIALNLAPGMFRKHFAFEKWPDFNRELWSEIYNDDSEDREFEHHIYLSDASYYAVQTALKNVHSASLDRYISVKQVRLEELHEDYKPGLVVINPPYGERLSSKAHSSEVYRRTVGSNGNEANGGAAGTNGAIASLYRAIGTALKHQFTGSTAWVISSNEDALKCIGLKPSQKIHLMNGELDCLYNQYELFQGERREYVAANPGEKKPNRTSNHGSTTDRKLQLSPARRTDRQVPARGARPQQAAGRDAKRGPRDTQRGGGFRRDKRG